MEFKFQKRRGIGNVITTLIILIASVVLGAGVIFFGGSMFQTNTQQESLKVSNVHSWVANNGTGQSVTAFAVQNTGSKPIAINSISMRGFSVPNTDWYSCGPTCGTLNNINTELTADYTPANIVLGDGATAFTAGPVGLAQGEATIVYVDGAGNLAAIDAGNTYALQLQAGQVSAVQQVLVVATS
jgi:hypothetical protein